MKLKFSKKVLLIVSILVLMSGSTIIFVSPLNPFAKESFLFCAKRDGITQEKLVALSTNLIEIKDKATVLSEYDNRKMEGVAFQEVMFLLNQQLGDYEQKISPIVIELDEVQTCRKNDDYNQVTKNMLWSLQYLITNLKYASEYSYSQHYLWPSNAKGMLAPVSRFEAAYKEFNLLIS